MSDYYIGFTTDHDPRSVAKHHGVLGQKWGVQNGPPYPLDSDISTGKKLKNPDSGERGMVIPAGLIVYTTMIAIGLGMSAVDEISYKAKRHKYDKERENAPVDPKSGLKLKQKELSIEEDAKRINPGFNRDEYTTRNCMLCTTAYEMRRRGYEVMAKAVEQGFYDKDIKKWYPKAVTKKIDNKTADTGEPSTAAQYENFKKAMSSQPEGARGYLNFQWKSGWGGHSVAYEIKDGKPVIIDSQVAEVYTKESAIKNYLSDTRAITYTRVDNVAFDKKRIKEAVK